MESNGTDIMLRKEKPRATSKEHLPETASASMQEIMSARPGAFIRRGTALIFIVLILLISAMWFVRYPDILEGAAVITTDPLPIKLKSETGGRLFRIFSGEGSIVGAGQPIVELENNTGFENVVR